jgi:hypothetical protein
MGKLYPVHHLFNKKVGGRAIHYVLFMYVQVAF